MTAPRVYARWAGALALVLVVLGPFSMMYVPSALFVPGDAAATAQKILASEGLFRLGILSDLAICLTEVVLLTVLYALMKPVSPVLALMATFARLAMAVVQGANVIASIAVLVVLREGTNAPQLVQVLLGTHEQAVHVWEAFFALHCLLLGVLVFRAGFVPKGFGPLMAMAALGYLANGVGNLAWPQSKQALTSVVAVTAIFGELPFFLWLLVKAVNVEAWEKRRAALRAG
jgi:Domain of unknown function (DUF4386)